MKIVASFATRCSRDRGGNFNCHCILCWMVRRLKSLLVIRISNIDCRFEVSFLERGNHIIGCLIKEFAFVQRSSP